MPQNFDLTYIDENGEKQRPIMIHRVCYGSIERFIGIITEHFAGKFPTWLAPIQATVMTLPGTDESYAENVYNVLRANGVRCEFDNRNEKIGYKIREARQVNRVPHMIIIGAKEIENNVISIRNRDTDQTVTMPLDEFVEQIKTEIKDRV